jgi:hypothetical protein
MTDPKPGADFTPSVIKEARRRAAFKCAYCHSRGGDEVHHITPKADGGTNDLDNAVFLCAQCHTDLGSRAEKRKQITEARDWWYEKVEVMYSRRALDDLETLESMVDSIATKQDVKAQFVLMQEWLHNHLSNFVSSVEQGSSSPREVMNVASTMVSSIVAHSGPAYSFYQPGAGVRLCECGTAIAGASPLYSAGPITCPTCGRKH